jgi:hypothetical protein
MTYGRFREGEIHWTLLSLLMSDGHSKQLFAELTRLDVVHRRQRVFGVGRCGVEPRSADRGAIGPEAVVVAAHDGDRTVGHDRVDEDAGGLPPGKWSIDQPPPEIHSTSGFAAA